MPTVRLSINRVRVEQAREASGDRPYLAVIQFRARIGRASEVNLLCREPHDWVSKAKYNSRLRGRDHLRAGDFLDIPWWMGRLEWRDVPLHPAGMTGLLAADVFGAIVVCLDNNNTPPHFVRDVMGKVVTQLHAVLEEEIRNGNLARTLRARLPRDRTPTREEIQAVLQEALSDLTTRIAVPFGTSDAIDWAFGSTFNPDRVVGTHVFLFVGAQGFQLEDRVVDGMPVTFGTPPTDHSSDVHLEGEGGRYLLNTTISRVSDIRGVELRIARLRVFTGVDNLEGRSRAEAVFVLPRAGGGFVERTFPLNSGRQWAGHSDEEVTLDFGANLRVARFGIRTDFSGGPWGDIWDIAAIQLEQVDRSEPIPIAVIHGAPFIRLTGERREFLSRM
jgi:hypothetical protein